MLSKTYRAADMRDAVHEFANDIVQSFTGKRGVFGSRIAFAMTGRGAHEIGAVDMDGGRMSVLTKMGSDSLLPAYSPGGGGGRVHVVPAGNNPDLWIVSAGGGRARRVSKQPGLNTGASWSPDGRVIALTLSHEGNSEIYRISPDDGRVLARLTNSAAIDSSPCFSPDGSQIAFVSNRQGSPQIFIMPAGGGAAEAGHVPGQVQPDAALEPAHRQAADRVHGAGRTRRVRHLRHRRQDRKGRSHHAGGGIEPGPDLVARRAPDRLHVEPRRHLGQQPRDASRGPDLEGRRLVAFLGPGAETVEHVQGSG